MKKFLAIVITVFLILSLVGCGKNNQTVPNNAYGDLLDQDYFESLSTFINEETWKALMLLVDDDGNWKDYQLITARVSEKQMTEYYALDIFDDDYQQKHDNLINSFEILSVSDVSDLVPTQEELDALYLGKTIRQLEDEYGYENCGYYQKEFDDPDCSMGLLFYYSGPDYEIVVNPNEIVSNPDDWSQNDLRELSVQSVSFEGFSFAFLENM